MSKRERGKEGEIERDTEIERERQTDRQTDRETDRQTEIELKREWGGSRNHFFFSCSVCFFFMFNVNINDRD